MAFDSITSLSWLRRRLRPEDVLLILFMLALIHLMNQTGRGMRLEFHLVYGFICFGLVADWMIWRVEGSGQRALQFARDFAPFVGCVLLATQYLRVHFVVDLFAGAALATLVVWLAPRLNVKWFDDARYAARQAGFAGNARPKRSDRSRRCEEAGLGVESLPDSEGV